MFRNSFCLKIFLYGCVCPQLALAVGEGYHVFSGGYLDLRELALVASVALVGGALSFAAVRRAFRPVGDVADLLDDYLARRVVRAVSVCGDDELARLSRSANQVVVSADWLLRCAESRANTDQLTGLFNRRKFVEDAVGWRGTLAIVDIDRFKSINDELGHDAGDRVLQGVARLLADNVRVGDLLARWGGEEFVILLPEVDPGEAARCIDRLRLVVAGAPLLPDRTVSFSAGVAPFDGDLEKAIRAADARLYAAKAAGRNRVVGWGLAA